ncbi:MAG: response regulator [Ignavibacteriales bacterium]|jgi:DNA-binding response OmpR family regulator|nr:response regulator [Ignavibacteriales bacterium]MBP7543309.1 response regulator [Ignavibacteriaceae bacterium]MBK7266207.1 response regulator [Ignavibacteriales bacterium]MBK7865824.1 response regulator [Ignavibacteriales bacterium]MBK8664116.1 response regulator [Ignavibacteriales bacterium]
MSLIAIIDDDPDIIDATSLVLMANGFEVITANNPGDGLKIIQEQKPALVILDVMMQEPDDGFFLAQKLRREGVTTPILMYTSVSKALGFQFGKSDMVPVDDFVEKPVSADVLIAKVNKLLNKS